MQGDSDHNGSPFTPPASSAAPTLLIALGIAAALYAAYRVNNWWSPRSVPVPRATAAPAPVKTAALNPAVNAPLQPPPRSVHSAPMPAAAAPSATAARPAWSRCEVNGRVEYSDTGCQGGVVKSSSANTQAALSVVQPDPRRSAGSTTTIYRCNGYSGVVFWSTAHCHQKKALVDRKVTVPTGMSLKEQITVAERVLARSQPSVATPSRQSASRPAATNASKRQSECKGLNERIRQLDAEARQPLSGLRQDQIRDQRRAARDRQFALRC